MPEYNGVSRVFELERIIEEFLDLWEVGTICPYDDADPDELEEIEDFIKKAVQVRDGDLSIEVELEDEQ